MRDDQTSGITPSAAKLKRIIGPSPGCRMLTPYEIELLRKSKREMAQVVREVLARGNDTRRAESTREETGGINIVPE